MFDKRYKPHQTEPTIACLRANFLISQITFLMPFRYNVDGVNYFKQSLALRFFGVLFSIVLIGIYFDVAINSPKTAYIDSILVTNISYFGMMPTFFVSLVLSQYNAGDLRVTLEHCLLIDAYFEKFPESFNRKKIKTFARCMSFGFVLLFVIGFFVSNNVTIAGWFTVSLRRLLYNIPVSYCCLIVIQMLLCFIYLTEYFCLTNRVLKRIATDTKRKTNDHLSNAQSQSNLSEQLRTLSRAHRLLSLLVTRFNAVFSVQILLLIVTRVVFVVMRLYSIYIEFTSETFSYRNVTFRLAVVALDCVTWFMVVWFCSRTIDSAMNTCEKESVKKMATKQAWTINVQNKLKNTFEAKDVTYIATMHYNLSQILKHLNDVFSIQMLVVIGIIFVFITLRLYTFYEDVSGSKGQVTVQILYLFWVFVDSSLLLVIISMCFGTANNANLASYYLHKIDLANMDEEFKTEVESFSLQLLHDEVTITAGGFFPINFTLLYTIMSAVTTYLVILIQFRITNEAMAKHNAKAAADAAKNVLKVN